MVFKCAKGMYQLQKNYRDAFNLEAFIEKYLEECFDKDMYIVGDISSEILRLKGFDNDPKSKNYYGFIDDYLDISCAFGCPFYVLKRIRNEDEYRKLERQNTPVITEDDRVAIRTLTKENFDKESLVLKTTYKGKPHIVIDPKKMNAIPKGELPEDLKDDKDYQAKPKTSTEPEKPVVVETFVSSSEDFDPSKKQDRFKGRNNNRPNPNRQDKPKPDNKPKPEAKPEAKPKPKPEAKPVEAQEQNPSPNPNPNKNHHRNRNRNRNHGGKPQNKEGQQ